jgi:hypothetical protein
MKDLSLEHKAVILLGMKQGGVAAEFVLRQGRLLQDDHLLQGLASDSPTLH